jgi:hypothetical protein
MLGMWGLAAVLLLMLDMVPSVELLGVGIATVVTLPYLLNKKVLVGAKNQLCNMAQGGSAQWFWFLATTTILLIPQVEAVNPNMQRDYDTLPGMKMWNGIPYAEFRRTWWVALMAGLGAIFQEGWTLLQCANGVDLGGPGNPGTPAQGIQSNNRNLRLFYCILNYVSANSKVYRDVRATFQGDGRGLYVFLHTFGHMRYTRRQTIKREHVWKDASVEALKIPIDEDTCMVWKEWVASEGEKLGKTPVEMREKYLEGFPESFDTIVTMERSSNANGGFGNYVFPINYPNHYPAALAGIAHPQAGQPDLDSLAQNFTLEWVDKLALGQIRKTPRPVNMVESANAVSPQAQAGPSQPVGDFGEFHHYLDDTPKTAFQCVEITDGSGSAATPRLLAVKRESITERTVCMSCGGLGHVSRIDGQTCLALALGIRIPMESLAKIQYPDGITFPNIASKFRPRGGARPSGAPGAKAKVRFQSGYDSSGGGKNRVREVTPVEAPPAEAESDEEQSYDVELAVEVGPLAVQ